MSYQIALAVMVIAFVFALLWGGALYYEREEAREDAKDLREDLTEVTESRDRWKKDHNNLEVGKETFQNEVMHNLKEAEADRNALKRERDDFKRCFESTETERDAARAQLKEALPKITDLSNLVARIENAPLPEDVKGSYRITAIRGPYRKTRERLARRAARSGRKATAS